MRSAQKFILNVMLDASGQMAEVVAGDVIAAHRAGVEIARPIYTQGLEEKADIVVSSSHPADRDLWQSFKPVNNCGVLIRDAGTLIPLILALEGLAQDHTQLVDFATTPAEKGMALMEAGKVADEVAAAIYLAYDQPRRRIQVALVSHGISCEETAKIGAVATTVSADALQSALLHHDKSARVGVVTQGADIMATFRKKASAYDAEIRGELVLDVQ